jgi:tripartite-type tricarboxylate transporter receptor subunit TctC
MFMRMKLVFCVLAATAALSANGQEYPTRTITIVVPFPAGSISDTVARVLADKIRPSLGQSVVIENKPSVGGIVGAQQVARSKPDGYTIMLGSNSTNAINPYLFKKLPYDPTKDFAPITMAGEIPAVLIARPDLPVKNLADVVQLGKTKRLTYAYGNTTNLIAGETLKSVAAIDLTTVPYKGEPLGMNDLLGGQVDLMSLNLPVAFQMIKSGKVKAVALTGPRKVAELPDLQLSSESLPKFSMPNGWLALFAPAGTPKPVIDRLHKELAAAMSDPEVKAKIEATGGYILYSTTPDQLQARINEDARRWAELIRSANVPAQ